MVTVKMRCPEARGRRVKDQVVLRLVGAAGGWCEKPDCATGSLWHELPNGEAVRLAEVAHIVAASDAGPRGDKNATTEELVGFDNLVLLCPTCHTIVDRAPEHYPENLLKAWKLGHESRLRSVLGVKSYRTRIEARTNLIRILAQNRSVFEQYGPGSPASAHPETSATWLREVQEVILPNNTRISALLETNSHLLQEGEHLVVGQFEAHRRGLEARHLGIDPGVAAPQFPVSVERLFAD